MQDSEQVIHVMHILWNPQLTIPNKLSGRDLILMIVNQ